MRMRRYFLYLSMILLATGLLASCNDDFDTPPMVVPTAKDKPNTTIADFKAKYWKDVVNYIDTVKDDIVIHGYVTSSDETGNIYKSLYIQDETGGLTISVNQNSLYNTYRVGQEIVIPMKGAWIGKYNGQQQLGYPQYYQQGSVWEATFLPQDTWEGMAQLNGLPNMAKVDTMTVKISDLKTDKASLLKYQGRLVKLQNVKFEAANGELTYAEAGATTNRNLVDNQGNTIVMRNSNYATFRNDILPLGSGDVVGLLYYYNTHNGSAGTWQLYIRSTSDVIGFSTSTKGLLKDPYSIAEAISLQNQGKSGWVSGYVVGAVAPEVTSVKSNSDIEWKAPTTLDNTLVIADDPNCTDASKCVAVSLPQGTPFRAQANLKDNEAVYKTKIWVKGSLAPYMNMAGITGNSGSTEEFRLSVVTGGVTSLNEGFDGGKLPTGWTVATVSGDKSWYVTSFDNNYYAAMTGYKGTTPPFESWLITPALDIKNATSKVLSFLSQVNGYGSTTSRFQVYVLNSTDPATATVKQELNAKLAVAPASGYSAFVESGDVDLSKWADGSYYIGFRFYATKDANYATWCVDNVKFGQAGTKPQPSGTSADLSTMNGGLPTANYGNYTSAAGWAATNASLLRGGAADANPVFTFIGTATGSNSEYATAVNLSGKTTAVGKLVSPVLKGGCATLKFIYGCAYTESKGLSMRVDIKQNGVVVKSFTVTKADAVKYTAYDFSEAVGVTGDFTIEFTNLSPSGLTTNKDRVAVWNIHWTQPASAPRHARR